MQALLRSPTAVAVLELDAQQDVLHTMLNNDLYKIGMQRMYCQFLSGVSADFALNIRRCSGVRGNPLARMRDQHPQLFRCVCVATATWVQQSTARAQHEPLAAGARWLTLAAPALHVPHAAP